MIKVGDMVKWRNTDSKVRKIHANGDVTIQTRKGYGTKFVVNANEIKK